jgi:hypothetical protein
VRPFVEGMAGLAVGTTQLDDAVGKETEQRFTGWQLGIAGGLLFRPPHRRLGYHVEVGALTAPVIENLVGDTHDSGGVFATSGISLAL